jgi:hypothetical protein
MSARGKTPRGIAALLALVSVTALAGCGDDDFKNEPRAPLPIELTGVIQPGRVTVSPHRVGAGPVLITISNQTDDPHSVTLSGGSVAPQRVSEVAPSDTTSIRRTLAPGVYVVTAGEAAAVPREIRPARLTVGRERPSSSSDLSLP